MTTEAAALGTAQVDDPRAALEAAVADLENRGVTDLHRQRASVHEAYARAQELGAEDLAQRATLLLAAVALHEGRLGEAGQLAHRVRDWAEHHDTPYVLARAHRELCIFYRHVGDVSDALTHGVLCVSNLTDDVAPAIRARHLVTLAVALDDSGSTDEGARRSGEALAIATALADDELSMLILNNMTYTAVELGDEAGAQSLAARMLEVIARGGRPLALNELDTIARVAMMSGRYDEVEARLGPVLAQNHRPGRGGSGLSDESDAVAQCLLTLTEARRLAGRFTAAQQALDHAVRECDQQGLARLRARCREEQAAVYAATGRHGEAYQEHRAFHAAMTALHDDQREARARALQAVFEANEARRASERFREMAHRDALTGLYNRRYVNDRLPALLAEAAAARTPLSLAILDLDHFKRINDTLSHSTGDAVLQHVALVLQDDVTDAAIAARIGGEEFLLIMPGVDAGEAAARCERLRLRIRAYGWAPVTGGLPVTTSVGVTTATPGQNTPSSLFAQADRNLYAAKRGGRDRVVTDLPTT